MSSSDVRQEIRDFIAERDWDQFHSPENLAKSIVIEAGELLEHYQWGPDADVTEVADELADVLTYCFQLADKLGLDVDQIVRDKLTKSRAKYPADQARGRSTKYTKLGTP